jgi:hypothetical protein
VCICFWIGHSIASGIFFDINPRLGCIMTSPILVQYSSYFYYPVLCGVLPVAIASFFGILAYHNVRRIVRRQIPILRRRLDKQMTAMVLTRVIVLVCTVLPYAIYRVFIINYPISPSDVMKFAIARLVQGILISWLSLNYTVKLFLLFE